MHQDRMTMKPKGRKGTYVGMHQDANQQNNKNVPSFLGSWAKFLAIDSIAEVA